MRISVDRDRCCGAGLCWAAAPTVFDVDDEGIVLLLTEFATDDRTDVLTAAKNCPTGTIQLEDS